MDMDDLLQGNMQMDISHTGGEFSAILEDRLVKEAKAAKAAQAAMKTNLTKNSHFKGLCDLHKVPYSPGQSEQFTIAYNVYNSLLHAMQKQVEVELRRDTPNWRLKNCCSVCTYKLEGEAALVFEMLFTMDGNDSLKRILRCSTLEEDVEDKEGNISRDGPSKERTDTRKAPGDYYLDRETVDKWTKEIITQLIGETVDVSVSNRELCEVREKALISAEYMEVEDNLCAERWKNMINELTARMWGIFDKTGIFLALCRHGFVLLVADMVRSEELAKYPLAIVEALLKALGKGLGGGYDIGCKFKSTLGNSPLGELAQAQGYQSLLKFLATYMVSLGIKDLEGCERFFSKSNALAASTRYASVFHQKQEIVGFMMHTDCFENSANLNLSLCQWMKSNGVAEFSVFDGWLREEFNFLSIRDKEPAVETLEMEYYQNGLIQGGIGEGMGELNPLRPHLYQEGLRVAHQKANQRAALECRDKNLEVVLHLEWRLGVTRRWKAGDLEWESAAVLVGKQRYQRCIDKLEKLVISRLFELTNMNQSKTGYKMRKHMSITLELRSKAIKTALVRYNAAAAALHEPRPPLSWEEVDEDTFLCQKEEETRETKPAISHQISMYREERTCFNALHMSRFRKLAISPGFMGMIVPGKRRSSLQVGEGAAVQGGLPIPKEASPRGVEIPEESEEDWEDNGKEDEGSGLYGNEDEPGEEEEEEVS
ncbi:hypothetical protein B0H10DRAFT_2164732 [Mycena sp. CBHHK59/15]|nr:hypothetical protein B0H10DRAFT_2164732 [Mycena sp. CBHHK59/15]